MRTRIALLFALLAAGCSGGEEALSMQASGVEANVGDVSGSNRRPVIEGLYLSPQLPVPGDRVTASVEASDPDGDLIEIVYQWSVDGRRVEADASSLHVENLRKGSVIEVAAVARDGKEQSEPVRAAVHVGNTVPVLQGVVIEPLGEVTADRDVTASPKAVDPDGDDVSFEYSWYVNGSPAGDDSPVLSAEHFDRGDQIEVTVIAYDLDDRSAPLRSAPIPVVNAVPKIVSVPGVFDDDGVFRYALEVEDVDGDRMFRYRLEEAPEGMQLDIVRGELSWEPREDQAGVHPVVVTVDDRAGGVARQRFDVQVEFESAFPAAAAR